MFLFFYFCNNQTSVKLLSHHQHSHCNMVVEITQKQPSVGGAMVAQGSFTSTWGKMPIILGFILVPYDSILLFPP